MALEWSFLRANYVRKCVYIQSTRVAADKSLCSNFGDMSTDKKRIHFTAIGGAAMHNLALALHQKGYEVTGSDDEINEPSKTRLLNAGLLPAEIGWFPEKITKELDGVILGMHARADNPELVEAQKLGIPVYSYPEYLYEHSKDKLRVVIGGSHGKTTITAMILHVLKSLRTDFDYMVGAKLEGFDTMVRLSEAPLIVLEGDEYLSSPVDRRPKFHLYKAEIGLISGIAWDHINVFPTFENYVDQFRIFANEIPERGTLIYCAEDKMVKEVAESSSVKAKAIPYTIPPHRIENGITYLETSQGEVELLIFGEHNLQNLEGARLVCEKIGINKKDFYRGISTFKGAARRLELLGRNETVAVYKDFAHSPSKLKATTQAVRTQFPDRKLISCMELHTFSSLNEDFLDQYAGSMAGGDVKIVYFNPHTIAHKKLKEITPEMVRKAFSDESIKVYTDSAILQKDLLTIKSEKSVFLMMSSGTFDGMNLENFAKQLIENNQNVPS
jgi:UDP-N-acetylmuramate: L-alanyl-gamma-D-glutamyl-meso-diaminopimelate ligase